MMRAAKWLSALVLAAWIIGAVAFSASSDAFAPLGLIFFTLCAVAVLLLIWLGVAIARFAMSPKIGSCSNDFSGASGDAR